jgi:hypothetical protein
MSLRFEGRSRSTSQGSLASVESVFLNQLATRSTSSLSKKAFRAAPRIIGSVWGSSSHPFREVRISASSAGSSPSSAGRARMRPS